LPFVFFTVVLGLARVQEWASSRWSWGSQLLVSVSVIYLAVIAAVEVAHMRTYVVARTHGSPEFAGYKMAQWVSTQEYDRLVFHLAGVDLARLALPDFAEKSQFALYSQDFRTHYERDYKGQKVLFVAPDYFWPAVRPHPCGRRTRMTFS